MNWGAMVNDKVSERNPEKVNAMQCSPFNTAPGAPILMHYHKM